MWAFCSYQALSTVGNIVGDCLLALVGSYFIQKSTQTTNPFRSETNVIKFIFFGAILGGTLSAIFGVSARAAAGMVTADRYFQVGLIWWVGDVIAIMLITPIVVNWTMWKDWKWLSKIKLTEVCLLIASIIVLGMLITGSLGFTTTLLFPLVLILSILVWSVFRFPANITYIITFLVVIMIIITTENFYESFIVTNQNSFFIDLQLIIFTFSATTLILVGGIVNRKYINLELRKSERNFYLLAEATFESIVFHSEGVILKANEHFLELCGQPEDAVIGQTIDKLLPIIVTPESLEIVFEHIRSQSDEPYKVTALRPNGETIPVEVRVKIEEIDGCMVRIIAIRDISDWEKQQKSLVAAQKEAMRTSTAKSEFLSSMSHELRTPLNAILGFSSLLELDKDELTAEQLNFVREISHGGEHLLSLINGILDLAKIETGNLQLSMSEASLREVIEDCQRLFFPLAKEKEIEIDIQFPMDKDYILHCDPFRLKQALLNYMSNAITYNSKGGKVKVHLQEIDSKRLRIIISDNGFGLNEEQLSVLFQPFERANAKDLGIDGTGIGLIITKSLVELMGGAIGVESTSELGSDFWLELNIASTIKNKNFPLPPNNMKEGKPIFARYKGEVLKILYIDDNQVNISLLEHFFMRHQGTFEVVSTTDPRKGVEMALTETPDVVFLDIKMPDMDGFEVLKGLRKNIKTKDIPVIAVSGNAMVEDVEKGFEAGFNNYLTKPIDFKKMVKMIENY